ncbi:MAG: hypothetical protein IT270_13515, partial [Saprospiraceae bacterium]|nr:hypothetical protein [Saprospiraceae bacterium]
GQQAAGSGQQADRFFAIVLFLVLLLPGVAMAQNDMAKASFDSAVVETGDDFAFELSVSGRAGEPDSVAWQAWAHVLPKDNRISESGWTFNTANRKWENKFTFITFDSMEVQLPPLPIRIKGGKLVYTNSVKITVIPTPSPEDPADMLDIRDIRREPSHWTDYLPWILAVAGIILAALLFWWWQASRKKKRVAPVIREIILAPHEAALRQLDELEAQELWQKGQIKAYYDGLSTIVRRYLDVRYNVPVLESTTQETLRLLETNTDVDADMREVLAGMLQQADLAKFAKGIPPAEFHSSALASARDIIRQTQPSAPAPAAQT